MNNNNNRTLGAAAKSMGFAAIDLATAAPLLLQSTVGTVQRMVNIVDVKAKRLEENVQITDVINHVGWEQQAINEKARENTRFNLALLKEFPKNSPEYTVFKEQQALIKAAVDAVKGK